MGSQIVLIVFGCVPNSTLGQHMVLALAQGGCKRAVRHICANLGCAGLAQTLCQSRHATGGHQVSCPLRRPNPASTGAFEDGEKAGEAGGGGWREGGAPGRMAQGAGRSQDLAIRSSIVATIVETWGPLLLVPIPLETYMRGLLQKLFIVLMRYLMAVETMLYIISNISSTQDSQVWSP